MKHIQSIILTLSLFLYHGSTAQTNRPNGSTLPGGAASYSYAYPLNFGQSPNYNISKYNYKRIYRPLVPMTTVPAFNNTMQLPVIIHTRYSDGWNRPLMDIVRNNSSRDIIKPYDYRVSDTIVSYLPYPDTFQSSFHKAIYDRQKNYYNSNFSLEAQTAYSRSVTGRPGGVPTTRSYMPGKKYTGDNRGAVSTLNYNNSSEIYILTYNAGAVCKTGTYNASELTVNRVDGTHNDYALSYTDKSGNLICKREYAGNAVGVYNLMTTYYIYNDLGRLVCMVPPKATEQFYASATCLSNVNDLCFQYAYNEFGHVIAKFTPGRTGADSIVYDPEQMSVLEQSPLLRSQNKRAFSIYDHLGRVIMTGLYSGNESWSYWNNVINHSYTPVTHYDQYSNPIPADQTLEYWLINRYHGTSLPTSLAGCIINTYNYYDDYAAWPANLVSFNTSDASKYLTGPTTVTPTFYPNGYGKLVASRTKLITNGVTNNFVDSFITSVYFYDELGQVIQTQVKNPWNNTNWDYSTVQFNFSGDPLLSISKHYAASGSNKPSTKIYTQYTYGEKTGRLGKIEQKIDTGAWYAVALYSYDELGRAKSKKLGGYAEVQNYTYNMRGQLVGINAAQINDTTFVNDSMTYFSELCYETGFENPRYDGSLSGYKWRSPSSKVSAYGYLYDNAGRITGADYRDYSFNGSINAWNKVNRDYSVSNIDYDANGNIKTMNQRGFDSSFAPANIDVLSYTYDNGNRLVKVTDGGVGSPFHDFDNGSSGTSNDYEYDEDGNLILDHNKDIDSIKYNQYGLATRIKNGSGATIDKVYDAMGGLIQKTVTEGATTNTYHYWGPFVYRNDSLEYVMHPEGRARWYADSVKYDYFVKDHLGNVRTMVTQQVTYDSSGYPATYELIAADVEEVFWSRIGEIRDLSPDGTPDDVMAGWLDGTDPDKQIGSAIVLHGMAGDQFNVKTYAWYEDTSTENMNTYALPNQMLTSLTSVLNGAVIPGGEGTSHATIVNNLVSAPNYDIYEGMKQFITDPAYPRVYLNYLVFDESFNIDADNSQIVQLKGAPSTWHLLELPTVFTMPKNGYVLIYFSNESVTEAALNNTFAIHYKGRLLEEQMYYPHGLVVEAGSNNPLVNKYLTQTNEMQREIGLELFDFNARNYDQQIGRFTSVDPLADFDQESFSPYHFCYNDPGNIIDPLGLKGKGKKVKPSGCEYGDGSGDGLWDRIFEFLVSVVEAIGNAVGSSSGRGGGGAPTGGGGSEGGSSGPSGGSPGGGMTGGSGSIGGSSKNEASSGSSSLGGPTMSLEEASFKYRTTDEIIADQREVLNASNHTDGPSLFIQATYNTNIVLVDGELHDFASYERFYNEHSIYPAQKVNGLGISQSMPATLNGSPTKLYSEVVANIVKKGPFLTVGHNYDHTYNDVVYSVPGCVEPEPGAKSSIHIHPLIGWYQYILAGSEDHGGIVRTFNTSTGPSKADYDMVLNSDYYHVVVERNYIYLYHTRNNFKTYKFLRRR